MADVFSSGFSTPAFIDALADVYNGVSPFIPSHIPRAYMLTVLRSSPFGQFLPHSACLFGVSSTKLL